MSFASGQEYTYTRIHIARTVCTSAVDFPFAATCSSPSARPPACLTDESSSVVHEMTTYSALGKYIDRAPPAPHRSRVYPTCRGPAGAANRACLGYRYLRFCDCVRGSHDSEKKACWVQSVGLALADSRSRLLAPPALSRVGFLECYYKNKSAPHRGNSVGREKTKRRAAAGVCTE